MRAPAIAVCGQSRSVDPAVLELSRQLGAELARQGLTLVCGGMGGVMDAACRGAAEARRGGAGGLVVGIIPGAAAADANAWCDVVIPTGMGYARNFLVAMSGDAVILVGGGAGTLSEAALAWQFGKPIVALAASGGWAARLAGHAVDERRGDVIASAADPAEAVRLAVAAIGPRR